MFLGRAHELCRDAGLQLVVLPYNFEAYEDVKEKVADILFRYGAELDGRVNQVSCDESYVELHLPVDSDSFASSAGDAESLARSIRREIFDATECTASIGVAKNMFLAKVGCLHLVVGYILDRT
jgi:DNA repair protein REV1